MTTTICTRCRMPAPITCTPLMAESCPNNPGRPLQREVHDEPAPPTSRQAARAMELLRRVRDGGLKLSPELHREITTFLTPE
ncbi:MAG TPA: hypothetical protein VJP88_08705 [Caulobacteraceae bacterium]|nr:hypothetical protein [Caulobacteraceae bacterium]